MIKLSEEEQLKQKDNKKWFAYMKNKEWTLDKAIEFIERYEEYSRGYPGDCVTDEEAYHLHLAKNYIAQQISLGRVVAITKKDKADNENKAYAAGMQQGERYTYDKALSIIKNIRKDYKEGCYAITHGIRTKEPTVEDYIEYWIVDFMKAYNKPTEDTKDISKIEI
jgi:hypothetical protein